MFICHTQKYSKDRFCGRKFLADASNILKKMTELYLYSKFTYKINGLTALDNHSKKGMLGYHFDIIEELETESKKVL